MGFKIKITNMDRSVTEIEFETLEQASTFAREYSKPENLETNRTSRTPAEAVGYHNKLLVQLYGIKAAKPLVVTNVPRSLTGLATIWGAFEGMSAQEFLQEVNGWVLSGYMKGGATGLDAYVFYVISGFSRANHSKAKQIAKREAQEDGR